MVGHREGRAPGAPSRASLREREERPIQLKSKIRLVAEAAAGKKAEDLVALDLKGIASFTDCFIICGGNQRRQTQAICDAITERLREKGVQPGHVEGYRRGEWILIDLSDLVVHVFTRETRDFYSLEKLWGDAPRMALGSPESRRDRDSSTARKG